MLNWIPLAKQVTACQHVN
uniref:Uncharacterized protein n=1 Tax=Rhizophora mucronata TaxID=61149 RepID=A0A2P2MZZ9_RHIMU